MSTDECLDKLKEIGIPGPRALALLKAYGLVSISKWSPTEIQQWDKKLTQPITARLDAIASEIESQGEPVIAFVIDQVSDFLDGRVAKGWPKKLEEGRFTAYCKQQGFTGPCKACADKAMKSPDASVRGMAAFYVNTTLKRKEAGGGE
jgi:hypothetical protein